MSVWEVKNCPCCNGDLFVQREAEGWFECCLLCGYERDVSDLVTVNTVGQIKLNEQLEEEQRS